MNLTLQNKALIDVMTFHDLIFFKDPENPRGGKKLEPDSRWFEGETGKYWFKRMEEVRLLTKADDFGYETYVANRESGKVIKVYKSKEKDGYYKWDGINYDFISKDLYEEVML